MTTTEETTFDPKRRRLCPDGACVGLIGDNGRCKVCGMPAAGPGAEGETKATDSGSVTWDTSQDPAQGNDEGNDEDSDDSTLPRTLADVAHLEGGSTFDPQRRLCSDGSCLGVIGADGRCNVCGLPSRD
jgi:hypothetical protein